ncbi:hypothetical protein [Microcystis aeruginosa]|nr:hypothetical protein [Microcystis aeruginosa]MDB9431610.1 hypothetical protein [Microcystis aeruginosa CS-552/01]
MVRSPKSIGAPVGATSRNAPYSYDDRYPRNKLCFVRGGEVLDIF